MDSPVSNMLSLPEAVGLLRKAHSPRGLQALRDQIRRGTLRAVRRGRFWYVYRDDIKRLARQPSSPKGGRPRAITDSSSSFAQGRLFGDVSEILRMGSVPIETRITAMLGGQAFFLSILKARLERQHPRLSPRDLVLKMFQEPQDGEPVSQPDVLRRGRPRAR